MNAPSLLARASTTRFAVTMLALASVPATFRRALAIRPDPVPPGRAYFRVEEAP